MKHRELLGLAAKAAVGAGEKLECPDDVDGIYICRGQVRAGFTWRPLADDGDAFRLAIRLGIVVDSSCGDYVSVQYVLGGVAYPINVETSDFTDMFAAARWAIVQAAAQLGAAL